MTDERAQKYLTLRKGAEQYGLSERTLRRRIAEGTLPAIRVGPRSIRIAAADLERLGTPIPTANAGGSDAA
jgi:excisionase family DNA binding protein